MCGTNRQTLFGFCEVCGTIWLFAEAAPYQWRMRILLILGLSIAALGSAAAQASGHWPPDSLTNTRVIPHATPVMQVVGTMRNFTSDLGVRCQFCHVGREGQPLDQFDFVTDEKRTKQV